MSVELVNPEIDRVDAVNGPATGIPFLLFKSADGAPAEAPAEVEVVEKAAEPVDAPVAAPDAVEGEPVAKAEEPAAAEPVAPVEEPVAKAAEPAEEPAPEEPVAKSEEPAPAVPAELVLKSLVYDIRKGGTVALPTGLLELLGEVVAAYQQLVETEATAPASPADVETPAVEPSAGEPLADAMEEDPSEAPVEDALTPEAPEAPAAVPAPAEAPAAKLPPEPAPGKGPAEAPAPAAESTAPDEEDADTKKLAKSMESLILEAVAKATAPLLEANEELQKRLEIVEGTPVDSGPFLAGQTPGNGGLASLRGQDVGGAAVGLQKSAAPQPPSGMEALAAGLVSTWTGR